MVDEKDLNKLMWWLAAYVVGAVAVACYTGKPQEALALLNNVASGIFGAALAMMKQKP